MILLKLSIKIKGIWLLLLYILLAIVFLINWGDIPELYEFNYGVLFIGYIIVGGIYFFSLASGKVYFFDPFNIISFLYLMIMVIYPMYDYIRLDLTKAGVDTSGACVEGTIIFVASYMIFCLGYFNSRISLKSSFFERIDRLDDASMSLLATICWVISFTGSLLGQASRGLSIQYILTLGMTVQDDFLQATSNDSMLFLLMLGPTLIVAEVMITAYSKSFVLKSVTMALSAIILFMRGSRIWLLILFSAPVIYWYVKRKEIPSFKVILVSFMGALFLFATLQVARINIAQGKDFFDIIAENVLSLDTYMDVFYSDFSTYKVYYGILQAIPSRMDYLLGRGIFGYTLALIVPRMFWPGKPDAPEREVVYAALGQQGMDSGFAYPNIGIFYSEFGIIGCVIFMWIFGVLMSKSRKLYMIHSKSALILYSCLWPFCFQLTTRSISNQVYSVLFGCIPLFAAWIISSSFSHHK